MASGRFVGRRLVRIFGSCTMGRRALLSRTPGVAPDYQGCAYLDTPCHMGPSTGRTQPGDTDYELLGCGQPAAARVSRYVLMSSLIYPAITWALAAARVALAATA